MTDLLRYQRQVAWVCLILGCAVAAGLYFGFPGRWEYAAGVLLGVVAGVVRMRIMAVAILQVMAAMETGGATRSLFRHQMIGYGILAVALLAGFHFGGSDMGWTTLAGLLLPNLVLGLDGYLRPVQGTAQAEPDLRSDAGAEVTADTGADAGVQVGAGVGANVEVRAGTEVTADTGTEVGADTGVGVGAGAGMIAGVGAGRVGAQVGGDVEARDRNPPPKAGTATDSSPEPE